MDGRNSGEFQECLQITDTLEYLLVDTKLVVEIRNLYIQHFNLNHIYIRTGRSDVEKEKKERTIK